MCGIAGLWTNRSGVDAAVQRVGAVTTAVAHRGPDDKGVEAVNQSPAVVFGHTRLSILDLSSAGHQPMLDPLTRNWITYNGEIYNFPELRAELEALGQVFRSKCDTEVILKGYAQWGVGCWRRLRGIFAFGIWDTECRELHLVRDHLGVKPLYYVAPPEGLVFSSEVRAIVASGLISKKLSVAGLNSFLKYGSVQEPCSLVHGVESVPPGHYLTCALDGKVITRNYWSVVECVVRNWETQPRADEVRYYLEDSIQRQLISDVPVGVFLSGGVDSTVIAALAARAQPGAIKTFCIGVEQAELDESTESLDTAKFLGCQHSTLILEGSKVKEMLSAAIASYDQPSYDGLNTYFISKLVRQAGIKVALSGLGGDELFVGYSGFSKVQQIGRIDGWAHLLPASARDFLSGVLANCSAPGAAVGGTLSEVLDPKISESYFASRTLFSRRHIEKLTGIGSGSRWIDQPWVHRERRLSKAAGELKGVDRASFFEMQTYMLSTLLRDSDQMSMVHGLELRVPLIDPVLVEHVLPVAMKDKVKGREGKQLLFGALGNLLPAAVVNRRKRGFTLPFRQWMQRDLRGMVGERFLDIKPRGPWDERAFRQIWLDFQSGRVAWSRVLALYVLESWLQDNGVSV
jgi:asparagine synthase (glutamine-hydrolysing)